MDQSADRPGDGRRIVGPDTDMEAPDAPAGAEAWVIDVDARSFERDVVQRSRELPVVIDFWASWCGPCMELGPRLEKAAREGRGRFLLAKVDVDANPELAQAFRVQSIPMVVALAGGKLVDAFQGALPEAELEVFLSRLAPPRAAGALEQAQALLEEDRTDEAVQLLREHLRANTTDTDARILLARVLADAGRTEEAKKVLAKLDEEALESPEAKAVTARIEMAKNAGNLEALAEAARSKPDDPGARTAHGKALLAVRRYEEGLEELLEAVKLDPTHEGGAARQAMLEAFEILGLEDPVANDFRYRLSLQLFA